MEMNSAGGSTNPSTTTNNNMFENTNLLNEMNLNSNANTLNTNDQLDNLSNLIINTTSSSTNNPTFNHTNPHDADESTAQLEQYEYDMDKLLNDILLNEKEQTNQRLFQSFQTSACAVAQMFKDKTTSTSTQTSPPQTVVNISNNTQSHLTAWQSFQNSAGAITVLYKESLDACKVHYDLGVNVGQQRKLKELINWIKKKKRRSIRKDELISFLIGRQYTPAPSIFQSHQTPLSQTNLISSSQAPSMPMTNHNHTSLPSSLTSQQPSLAAQKQQFMFRQQNLPQQQQQAQNGRINSSSCPTSMLSNNSNSGVVSENTCSDLATFREALIMHNRSRDGPVPNHSHSAGHLQNYTNHHSYNNHSNQNHHHQQQQHQCDDLDCFFCEQIATHIEHKRSASSSMNFDMESPTRKRGRFY